MGVRMLTPLDSVDRPGSCSTGDPALVRMLRKLQTDGDDYLGVSPGGLPAGDATPSRQANTGSWYPQHPDSIYTQNCPLALLLTPMGLVKSKKYRNKNTREAIPQKHSEGVFLVPRGIAAYIPVCHDCMRCVSYGCSKITYSVR